MLSEGASLIDLGAASSRPGAREVSEVRETETIQRAVSVLRKTFGNILLSIDTYRSKVAKVGLDMGAVMINDISGGTFDNNMPSLAAQYGVPFVIMHMKGRPETMQENPEYEDVTEEVKQFFQRQIVSFQIENHDNLILDPGFGFGKTLQHNFTLLRNMDTFREIGYPLMAGFSRKSMIYKTLETNPDKALNGTTILNTVAVLNGADRSEEHTSEIQ